MSPFDDIDDVDFAELVAAEVKDQAPEAFATWVRQPEQLLDWVYFLRNLRVRVEGHFRASKARLEELKPPVGELPSPEYLQAKRDHDREHRGRARYLDGIETRLREADRLVRLAGIVHVGELMSHVVHALVLLEGGDVDGATEVLSSAIDRQADRLAGASA